MEAPVVYLIENSMHISRARASARRLSAVSVERFNSRGSSGCWARIAAGTVRRKYHVPLALLNKCLEWWRGCHSFVPTPTPPPGAVLE
jgi:hypothetical protein